MVATRAKLKVGDRIAIRGEIEKLFERDDRLFMTVLVPMAPAPITLDTIWANRAGETLRITEEVRLEGKVERISRGGDGRSDAVSIRIDGYAYRVTLGAEDIEKLK